jgi:hypothetical protein
MRPGLAAMDAAEGARPAPCRRRRGSGRLPPASIRGPLDLSTTHHLCGLSACVPLATCGSSTVGGQGHAHGVRELDGAKPPAPWSMERAGTLAEEDESIPGPRGHRAHPDVPRCARAGGGEGEPLPPPAQSSMRKSRGWGGARQRRMSTGGRWEGERVEGERGSMMCGPHGCQLVWSTRLGDDGCGKIGTGL